MGARLAEGADHALATRPPEPRSPRAITSPQQRMMAAPTHVHPSGSVANSTQPVIVAQMEPAVGERR